MAYLLRRDCQHASRNEYSPREDSSLVPSHRGRFMIHISVITRQGAPAGQPIAADFGPSGGTIGRADTNTLVLDDPDRTVSRVHAQVLCRDGQYFVIDRGSNPMQCNGVSL
eukprot:gene9087-12282_t